MRDQAHDQEIGAVDVEAGPLERGPGPVDSDRERPVL
jgi:hypothetical protein